ncbi:unnamed protein product [Diamesa serratosioi]
MASFYMIFSDEDDEEFASKAPADEAADDLAGNSNLSKLFGVEMENEAEEDSKSFKYIPQKDDKESPESENVQMNWNVCLAKIITAYKLIKTENKQENTVIGKLGFALLESEKKDLKAIVYKSKDKLESTLLIQKNTTIFVKKNFIQFLDNYLAFWSILFDNEADRDEVLKLLTDKCIIQRDEEKIAETVVATKEDEENADDENNEVTTSDKEEKQAKHIKANILSRMAKMGKKIVLPHKQSTTSEISDSSDTESSKLSKPKIAQRKPISASRLSSSPTSALQIAKIQPGPIVHSVDIFKLEKSSTAMGGGPSDGNLNLMMMQNTEIRFNLSKLENKVEKILDKIDQLNVTSNSIPKNDKNNNNNNRDEEVLELEEKVLSLKKDNLQLKFKIREQEASVVSSEEIYNLKLEVEALTQEKSNISIDVQNMKQKLEQQEVVQSQKNADIGELQSQLNLSNRLVQDMKGTIEKMEKDATANSKTDISSPEILIKEIMNNLYYKLCEQITAINEKELKQSEILKIIGQTIKQETSNSLKCIQK